MYLTVKHVTEYHYSEPAWDSFNELRLLPADDYRQTLLEFSLNIEPKAEVRSHRDYYGNVMHHFHHPDEHRHLRIEATSSVVTYPIPAPYPVSATTLPDVRHRFFEFLAPTERVPLHLNWFDVFGALPLDESDELSRYLLDMTRYLHGRFVYQGGSTEIDTPLTEFAKSSTGVCQDFAHAMLALCRSAGIPARYVSGYIHSSPDGNEDSLVGAEASHAWLEAFLPGSGWVGYDPTNGCIVTEAHVKIGVGRDYDDVPPTKGLRRGGGEASLEVEVQVRRQEREPSMVD